MENISKQYLWKLLLEGKCAANFSDIVCWRGANPKTKTQEEIDITETDKESALSDECSQLYKFNQVIHFFDI